MPRSRPPYSPAFRRQMVDLVCAGRSPDDLAREFEPTSHSIRAWVALAERSEGRWEEAAVGLATAERDELARLRREMRQLRLERDILSKAAAWFPSAGIPPADAGGTSYGGFDVKWSFLISWRNWIRGSSPFSSMRQLGRITSYPVGPRSVRTTIPHA